MHRLALSFMMIITASSLVQAGTLKCPADSAKVGTVCVDKYESSVWLVPDPLGEGKALVKKIQNGKAKLADLVDGGATQLGDVGLAGCSGVEYGATFPGNGNWTAPLYAVSIPGVSPSGCASWFQASQSCRLAGKRLLTNTEWQDAAAGTPDPGTDDGNTTCNITTGIPSPTGSRTACVSSWGVFDMVGNIYEWVSDWVPASSACPGWGTFSDDIMCLSGVNPTLPGPGAIHRGGNWGTGPGGGVFAVDGDNSPSTQFVSLGFRCGR